MRAAPIMLFAVLFAALTACTGAIGTRPDAGLDRGGEDARAFEDAVVADATNEASDAAASEDALELADAIAPDAEPAADAEPADLGVEDSGEALPCAQALICDDFESYANGAAPGAPWEVSVNGGAVNIDTTHAVSGTQAVLVHTNGGANFSRAYFGVRGAPLFPMLETALYGRARLYAVGLPAGSVHWTNIQVEGDAMSSSIAMPFHASVRYGGQHMTRLMANYDTGDGVRSDCWQHSQTTMPENRWACFEWYFDQASNHMDLWLDGTQLNDLTLDAQGEGCIAHDLGDQWIFPRFDALWLGWEHYQMMGAIDVWIDDVAIGPVRLGCN